MRWSIWTKTMGTKAVDPAVGDIVYFRRGNLPELGRIVAEGDGIRVPLLRCNFAGRVNTRRAYWRNRSQLYLEK
jgi:hypothetical protein